ncbi:hypothetical protein NDU88_002261 [Pleurodeles waltl]|uniref:Uncharacterized protein n=1 Tax=Pleurodeles waltl TaxID=8319 RepID=A0AAV7VDT7_PLEWA|nr:hypothetical protein NDU88_002261 [Pleurodeles waltl]
MITGFWKGGLQENNPEHIVPHQVDTQLTLNGELGADSGEKIHSDGASKRKHSLLTWLQAPEFPEVELLEGGKDHPAPLKHKEIHALFWENVKPGFVEQETYDPLQASQGKVTSPPTGDVGDSSHMAQTLVVGAEAIGTNEKVPDWPKDGADKL